MADERSARAPHFCIFATAAGHEPTFLAQAYLAATSKRDRGKSGNTSKRLFIKQKYVAKRCVQMLRSLTEMKRE
jgi:hypothetical protein